MSRIYKGRHSQQQPSTIPPYPYRSGLLTIYSFQVCSRHITTMKTSPLVLGLLAQGVSAHYFFDTTIRNGSPDPAWQYVRDFTRQTKYNPIKFSANPPADIRDGSFADGPDIRCNQGAHTFGSRTGVLEVNAGDEVRLRVAVGGDLFHPGE